LPPPLEGYAPSLLNAASPEQVRGRVARRRSMVTTPKGTAVTVTSVSVSILRAHNLTRAGGQEPVRWSSPIGRSSLRRADARS